MPSNQNTHLNADFSPKYEAKLAPLREAFASILNQDEELGGAVTVYLNGAQIADLWGGYCDVNRQQNWQRDTMVSTFSACKAMTALCLLHLIDQGKAQLDDPVVHHWPEFGRGGVNKSHVSLRHLLTHSAGLPTTRLNRPRDAFHWDRMILALERAPLLWEPGEKTAYHAVTFGHLVGEVVRRLSGQMPSAYFASHFAEPLGLDYTLRFQPENSDRTAHCDGHNFKSKLSCGLMTYILPRMGGWKMQYFRPCCANYHPNADIWRGSEVPAISGFGTARSLARVYAMIANDGELDGTRILSASIVDQMKSERPKVLRELGMDKDARIGLGMFYNLEPMADFGPNPNSFGHTGMGGTTSFCDPDLGLSFAYVCNHLYQPSAKSSSIIGTRARQLIDATYACLQPA